MKIAYFNVYLKQEQDGVTRCVYRMMHAARVLPASPSLRPTRSGNYLLSRLL